MTDDDLRKELTSNSKWNNARKAFSSWSGRIEQAQAQRTPLSPVEMRKMEFAAVSDIASILGVSVHD